MNGYESRYDRQSNYTIHVWRCIDGVCAIVVLVGPYHPYRLSKSAFGLELKAVDTGDLAAG